MILKIENYASHECRLRLSIRTSSSAFSLHDIYRFAVKLLTLGILKTSFCLLLLNRNFED